MSHLFDEISKSLARESMPRRESLRRLGAAIVGAVLSPLALGGGAAEATDLDGNRRRGHRHPARRQSQKQDQCAAFCSRCRTTKQQTQCLTVCRACGNDTDRIHGSCGAYVCCGEGQSYCRGRCVDLHNDANNCGACGKVCRGSKPNCVNGKCSGAGNACPAGQTKCGTSCVNLASDNSNCGTCGRVCGTGTSCINGTCAGSECPAGQTKCGTICTYLSSDAANCGACGHVCGLSTPHCNNGTCSECAPGKSKCGNYCTNLSVDSANCGACGNACGGSTPFCIDGTCSSDGGDCPGVDLLWDSDNCGACGVVCPEQTACFWGACEGIAIGA